MKTFALYVHIPFCAHKCPYCDFNTYAVPSVPEEEYLRALIAELEVRKLTSGLEEGVIETVFFGGGTPSLLSASTIDRFLHRARESFPFASNPEVSLEANPETLTEEKLLGYKEAGVNRLSFGAQSFSPRLLKQIGRVHTAQQTSSWVRKAHELGFQNISIDLMFGLPEQTVHDIRDDLREALTLPITHLSWYGLTIEKGTPFYQSMSRGVLKLPGEEQILRMMEILGELLEKAGFQHYEISNFARPGFAARHNLAYWNRGDYLGLGAGAHSFSRALGKRGLRWSNLALPSKYIMQALEREDTTSWKEELTLSGDIFEFFFLGLRKRSGVSLRSFQEEFGITVEALYPKLIDLLSDQELIELHGDLIQLTKKGIALSDSVVENFIVDEEKLSLLTNSPAG